MSSNRSPKVTAVTGAVALVVKVVVAVRSTRPNVSGLEQALRRLAFVATEPPSQ